MSPASMWLYGLIYDSRTDIVDFDKKILLILMQSKNGSQRL